MLRLALLTALLALAVPAAAQATTASVSQGVLTVAAHAGEANQLTIERDAAAPVMVVDRGAGTLTAGAGCDRRPDLGADLMLCVGVARVEVDAGDGGDIVALRDADGFADDLPATVRGGDGADTLTAGESAALLHGGAGDDVLRGGLAADDLRGDGGADRLVGGAGGDRMAGGDGTDTVDYTDPVAHVVTLGAGADDGALTEGDDVAADVERVEGGGAADVVAGSAAANHLAGAAGPDRLAGLGGDDVLVGAEGGDELVGGPGADELDAGDGEDQVDVRDGVADRVVCGTGTDEAIVDTLDTVAGDCERVRSALVDLPPAAGDGGTPPEPRVEIVRVVERIYVRDETPARSAPLRLSVARVRGTGRRVVLVVGCSAACEIRIGGVRRRLAAGALAQVRVRAGRPRRSVTVAATGADGTTAARRIRLRR